MRPLPLYLPLPLPLPSAVGLIAALVVAALATPSAADLRVTFYEGAPKDRFRFENAGSCTLADAAIRLDLSTSAAGLIFDVTEAGAGVEVFQPFQLVEAADALTARPLVRDGHTEIRMELNALPPGQAIAFTIDVDDTRGQRAITVSGSEIEGATVAYLQGGAETMGTFSDGARAVVPLSGCRPAS